MKLWISKIEITLAISFFAISAYSIAHRALCDPAELSCGGWEDLYAIGFLLYGSVFLASGFMLKKRGYGSWTGTFLIVASLVYLLYQWFIV